MSGKTGTAMPCPNECCELALGFFTGGDVGGELGGLAAQGTLSDCHLPVLAAVMCFAAKTIWPMCVE